MDPVLTCTCLRLHPLELLRAWQARALPIIQRMCLRGRAPDSEAMDATLALIMVMEKGPPEVFADENRHRSHHLPGCPWRRVNRRFTGQAAGPASGEG